MPRPDPSADSLGDASCASGMPRLDQQRKADRCMYGPAVNGEAFERDGRSRSWQPTSRRGRRPTAAGDGASNPETGYRPPDDADGTRSPNADQRSATRIGRGVSWRRDGIDKDFCR